LGQEEEKNERRAKASETSFVERCEAKNEQKRRARRRTKRNEAKVGGEVCSSGKHLWRVKRIGAINVSCRGENGGKRSRRGMTRKKLRTSGRALTQTSRELRKGNREPDVNADRFAAYRDLSDGSRETKSARREGRKKRGKAPHYVQLPFP
jgi:hypothetical protein